MASMSIPCPKICAANRIGSIVASPNQECLKLNRISFPHAPNPGFNGYQCLSRNQSVTRKRHAQLGEVTNSAPMDDAKPKPESLNGKAEAVESSAPEEPALSAFLAQISDLVKLVDSRDIVELELKQLDCELVIRKKEALQQPVAAPGPVYTMQPPMPHSMPPLQPAALSAAPSPSPSVPAPASAAPAKISQPSSSHPPFKCPMAGTFYRAPGPGEPPFVKVGDKVQKGQVVCIIEAMKLMNEIEADQSGTLTEILAEDGKPVSVDAPLFVVVP